MWYEKKMKRKISHPFYEVGIEKMLKSLGLIFNGRHHSGLDDSINIARIILELIKVRFGCHN